MLNIIKEKHTNEQNALIVENYPYGFLKTKIRYWIESNKKGDRITTQTLNPKTNIWNSPKYSTYYALMVLVFNDKNQHIEFKSLYPTTDKNEINAFLSFIGDYDLNDFQKEQIGILKAYSKVYKNVYFTIDDKSRTDEEQKKHDDEQKTIKDNISYAVKLEYLKGKKEQNTGDLKE